MCPACMATAALIITGAISTGGLAAIAGKLRGHKRSEVRFTGRVKATEPSNPNPRRDQHV
jgi:hypothetical protein